MLYGSPLNDDYLVLDYEGIHDKAEHCELSSCNVFCNVTGSVVDCGYDDAFDVTCAKICSSVSRECVEIVVGGDISGILNAKKCYLDIIGRLNMRACGSFFISVHSIAALSTMSDEEVDQSAASTCAAGVKQAKKRSNKTKKKVISLCKRH